MIAENGDPGGAGHLPGVCLCCGFVLSHTIPVFGRAVWEAHSSLDMKHVGNPTAAVGDSHVLSWL